MKRESIVAAMGVGGSGFPWVEPLLGSFALPILSVFQRLRRCRNRAADLLKSVHSIAGLVSVVLLASGCTTSQIDFVRKTDTMIDARERVAILLSTGSPLERDAVACIVEALRKAKSGVRIMTPDEFRRSIFYYGYPENPYERKKYFNLLANEPVLRERITGMDLRYVISLDGGTEQQSGDPFFGGGGGSGGGITVFGTTWKRQSWLEASIFDLKEVVESGTIQAYAEGRPWFLCVGVGPLCLPVGAAAFTESTACADLGAAVANFLTGGNLPESASPDAQPKK
jgi:hypothetical protein